MAAGIGGLGIRARSFAYQAAVLGGGVAPDPTVVVNTGTYPNLYESVPAGTTDGQRTNAGVPLSGTGTSDGGDAILGTGSVLESTLRSRRTSTAAANSSAGWSSATFVTAFWRGNAAGLGGFLAKIRFGLSAFVAGHQAFIGLRANNADIGNTDPIDLVDCVGIGIDPGEAQWSIFHNDGSGQCTKVALGGGFDVAITHGIELTIVAPSNGSELRWIALNLETGSRRSGVVSTNIPGSTTFLFAHCWANTGDSTTAVRIDLVDFKVGTPNPTIDATGDLGMERWDNVLANTVSGTAAGGRANLGLPGTIVATTISQPALTSGTLLGSTPRTRMVSGTTTNSGAQIRAGAGFHWRGNAAGLGGFVLEIRFAMQAWVIGHRMFVGWRALGSDIGTAEPNALVSIIGLGCTSSQTRWRLMHNDGSGAATEIDLGASFDVTPGDLLELRFVALPNASSIAYRVRNLTTGAAASGTLSTNIPANNVFVGYHVQSNTAGVSGTAVQIECVDVYAQAPYPTLLAA